MKLLLFTVITAFATVVRYRSDDLTCDVAAACLAYWYWTLWEEPK